MDLPNDINWDWSIYDQVIIKINILATIVAYLAITHESVKNQYFTKSLYHSTKFFKSSEWYHDAISQLNLIEVRSKNVQQSWEMRPFCNSRGTQTPLLLTIAVGHRHWSSTHWEPPEHWRFTTHGCSGPTMGIHWPWCSIWLLRQPAKNGITLRRYNSWGNKAMD